MKQIREGYKQTKVGIIPQDWEEYLFDDIFIFSTGKNIKQNEASLEFNIPCVRYGELYHMYNEVISTVINKTNLDKSELLFSKGDEILLPSAGEDPLDIGSASALTLANIAIGRTINILRPAKDNVYSQKYVSYYINQRLKNKISTLAKGSSISNVYNSDLKKLRIPLPPLKEQEKIAEILTTWDNAIIKQQELIKSKEEQKKGLMQKLLSGEVRFDGFTDKWKEVKLDKLVFFQEGPGVRNTQYRKIGVKLLNVGNINNNTLNLNSTDTYISEEEAYGTYNHFLVDEGDLLISCSGINSESFKKKIAFAKREDLPLCMNTSTMRFKSLNNKLSLEYLYFFFQTLFFEKQVFCVLTGSAQFNFGPTHIKWFKIKLPTLLEQNKITEVLSLIDDEIKILRNEQKELKLQKNGLMQKLLTGEMRVKI